MLINPAMTITMDNQYSPTLLALRKLESAGYVVDACLAEFSAIRSALQDYRGYLKTILNGIENTLGHSITIKYNR
ncbi:hypothetical protein LMG33818_000883 [Halomonadaceae bacterium LMG 33818]